MNRQLGDALILSRDPERLSLDLFPDLAKVREALVEMQELTVFGIVWAVDELEDERAPGDDALAAGQEVAADDAIRVALEFSAGGGAIGRRTHVSRTLDFPADWLPT